MKTFIIVLLSLLFVGASIYTWYYLKKIDEISKDEINANNKRIILVSKDNGSMSETITFGQSISKYFI